MNSGDSDAATPAVAPNPGESARASHAAIFPNWFWAALVMAVATAAAYWPVYSAGFIWDDDAYVTDNTLLKDLDGMSRIWFSAHTQSQYFPLVYTTLRMEYSLWGLNPAGYHIVNVCFHVINALLVWALISRLGFPRAWLAAAVFALHPVQVETVAWVTELKNTESTCFYLLTLFAWLNFCSGKGRWFYGLALVLYALALFAKTTACTLPAALLLLLWVKHEPITCRRVLQTAPFLLLGIGMGLISVWWEKHLGDYKVQFHLLGGPLDRLLVATHALWFYAGKVFWPAQLTFSYPHWDINTTDWRQYGWLVGCALVVACAWLARRKLGRGGIAVLIFFVAALSPMLGFIPLYTFYFSFVADHYQYFACLGLIVLGLGIAGKLLETVRIAPSLQAALAALLLLSLGAATRHQCQAYQSLETLWRDTLTKNPRSWLGHGNLGRILAQQGKLEEAEMHYKAALEINSDAVPVHYNYGNLLARTGRLEDAITQYRAALQSDPEHAEAHNNLGIILNRLHRTDEAIPEYEHAIFFKPDFAEAYYNLGNALSSEHKMDAAIMAYERALRLEPDSDRIRKRLQALGVKAD